MIPHDRHRRHLAALEFQVAGFNATRSKSEAIRDSLAVEVAGSLDAAGARLEHLAQTLNEAGKD